MLNRVLLFLLLALVSACSNKEKSYTCLDDAAKDKIGVLLESSHDDFISQNYPNADIIRINISSDLITALKADCCDVAIFTMPESVELLKENPDLEILDNNLCIKSVNAGFNKNDTSKVAFSDNYSQSTAVALVKKKNKSPNQGYRSINDLTEKRIGVLTASTQDSYVTENFPKATIIRVNDISNILLALKNGKCDVIVLEESSVKLAVNDHPEFSILDKDLFESEIALGFSLNNAALRDEFNVMLAEFRSDGTYDQIYKRWMNEDNPVMPKIDLPKTGIPIRVGVTGTNSPFDYDLNKELAGFDIELVTRFAERLKRPVEFQVMRFGGFIAALSVKKIDLIASGITITPERSKNVAFADPHHLSKSATAVLTKNLAVKNNTGNQVIKDEEKDNFLISLKDSFYSNLIVEKRYMIILNGLWETLLISVFAAVLGTLLGALVCFMRMSKKIHLNSIAKAYITIMRNIPLLVLLMLFYYVFFAQFNISATIIAIITFALNFAAYISVIFKISIENVDRGQIEAAIAMGFTKIQTFIFIVMPQAIKSIFPLYKAELISLVKMTSIVGYIAIEDLTKASDIIRSKTFDAFFPLIMVSIIYFLLARTFITVLNRINTKMTSR